MGGRVRGEGWKGRTLPGLRWGGPRQGGQREEARDRAWGGGPGQVDNKAFFWLAMGSLAYDRGTSV